jgi:hypothetical protein
LFKNQTIKKHIAVLLLLVFAVGIAPKAYFHDLLANHKDGSSCKLTHRSATIHRQSFNCHFDDLVVSAPFVFQADQAITPLHDFYVKQFGKIYASTFQSFIQHEGNRGPPSV